MNKPHISKSLGLFLKPTDGGNTTCWKVILFLGRNLTLVVFHCVNAYIPKHQYECPYQQCYSYRKAKRANGCNNE